MASTHQLLLTETQTHDPKISFKILTLTITLIFVLFSIVFLIVPYQFEHNNYSNLLSTPHLQLCETAQDFQLCQTYVSNIVTSNSDALSIVQHYLSKYVHQMKYSFAVVHKFKNQINGDEFQHGAISDCLELLDLSIDQVTDSVEAIGSQKSQLELENAHTWLSGVLTNHETCLDGLNLINKPSVETMLNELILRARAGLAMVASLRAANRASSKAANLIELSTSNKGFPRQMPSWVSVRDRKLLESSSKEIKANVVVAHDGSGDYLTLTEALAAAPNKSKTRYVIRVKAGTYKENVEVIKKKTNLMIVGDGMNSTIITGSLNYVDGTTTFRSATLAAVGPGFILQDICIQNTAGPEKHQAVALRVGSDMSVINRCRIDAYQDTLYAHSLRQFYRDCLITGTVDFIFGNAAVVFQKCTLEPRKPMANQHNMVTAQGRTDPNQDTGTSIQFCDIVASSDLVPVKTQFKSYLGRPWKEFSRTVVMQSYIDDSIDPSGWSIWSGDFALKTLYYGEFMNNGPGAGTSQRVNWTGYHIITDPAEARPFTVAELIQGSSWLSSTGVAFVEGLND